MQIFKRIKSLLAWRQKGLIREAFIRAEIPKGKMLVCWRDVDDMVYGWTLSADQEQDLLKIAALIWDAKLRKLEGTVKGGIKDGR